MSSKNVITRELAEAVAFALIHPDETDVDIAHDWGVEQADLRRILDEIDDDGADLEERIADAVEELWS